MHAIRRRTGASAVAAFFIAAPLAIGGAALAAEPEPETNSQVVFTGGGLLGVACGAKPGVASVTVPAESTLRVVNKTGRKAKLLLDGATRGEVASGATADVLFHHGPVELALKPDCVLSDEKAVRVEVLAAPPPPPADPPADDTPANPPSGTSGGGDGTGTKTGDNGGSDDNADDRAAAGDDRQDQEQDRPAEDDAADAATPGTEDPAEDAADPDEQTDPDVLAADSFVDPDGGTGVDGTTTIEGMAAEPLASVDPVSDSGPTGLLALIATVCVVGVSAGAIRAIIAQRATRTQAA